MDESGALTVGDMLLRLLLAGFISAIIGYERRMHRRQSALPE